MISVEKPGSPKEILEHVGVKGMKWGVRKAVDTAIGTKTAGRKPSSYKSPATRAAQSAHRKKVAKRVAIGVGVTAAAVGTAFVAYKLHQSGSKLPVLEVGKKATGKSGQLYVSNLSHAQWNQKIANQKVSARALETAYASIAERRRTGAPGWLPN